MNKIKNKSLESKVATLLNNDENNKEEEKDNGNNFKDKLNGIKNELSKKSEENSKNIFEFKYTTNQRKNNRYKNYFNKIFYII